MVGFAGLFAVAWGLVVWHTSQVHAEFPFGVLGLLPAGSAMP